MKTAALISMLVCATAVAQERPAAESESLYNFAGGLEDHTGAKVKLDVWRGHPVLITMFYSACTSACPIIISSIRRMENGLSPQTRANLRVLLVSMDPARDTPEAMTKILQAHGADPTRWKLARPAPKEVPELAALLGMTCRKNKDGSYAHSAEITLLDERGVIVSRLEAPGDDATELLSHLAPAR